MLEFINEIATTLGNIFLFFIQAATFLFVGWLGFEFLRIIFIDSQEKE